MVGINVSIRALNKTLLRLGNCPFPGGCPRALARVTVSVDKTTPDELGDRGVKPVKFRRIFRRAYGQIWSSRVGETTAGDAFFKREGVAFSQPLRPEWVVAFHQ